MLSVQEQLKIIKRGAVDIISEEELVRKLERSHKEKKPLCVKAGFDPTAPDIHLGHTVLLNKLRQFQDLGHRVFFLIGDFTARIGDPSGRSQIRKPMTPLEIMRNARTYKKQVAKVLNLRKIKVVFNSRWFERMSAASLLKLTMRSTISQMLARADFKKRLDQNQDVSLLEFMYPILQGYDSVILKSDIELGGTDQIFNLLVGRDLQKDSGQEPQVVFTLPLLEGIDGVNKMSKSLGNYIAINDTPGDMFGKVMSIPDDLMYKYYNLLTDYDLEAVKKMHPRKAKIELAREMVSRYYSKAVAKDSVLEFERIFSSKELPSDLETHVLSSPKSAVDIMFEKGLSKSKNEARRLIRQQAVDFNERRVSEENFMISSSGVLKVGSRRFLKIEFKG